MIMSLSSCKIDWIWLFWKSLLYDEGDGVDDEDNDDEDNKVEDWEVWSISRRGV